jgi:TRAP-type transport system small permease protein
MVSKVLCKITSFFSKFFATGAGLSIFLVFLIIFVNSTRRYTIGKSFEWGEQLPVFIAIYGIMFGMAWAYLNDQHIRFTILVDFIPEKFAKILYGIVDIIMVVTGVVLAYSGYLFALKRGKLEASGLINSAKSLSDMLHVDFIVSLGKMFPYQFALAIGGAMLVIASLLKLLSRFLAPHEDKVIEVS